MKPDGKTDAGLHYFVLKSPDDAPPVVLEVPAPNGRRWGEAAPMTMVGQSFGMRWHGRMLLLRVTAAELNPMNGRLRLTCA